MRAKLTALALLVLAGCDVQGHFRLPAWSLERMLEQPRADAYERSAFFADGRTMQNLPEGTVPRSAVLGEPEITEGRTESGAYVAEIPVPLTMALLHEGKKRYEIVCAACHGERGDGSSRVARYMEIKKPISFLGEYHRAMPPGQVFATITHGVGLMPSYAVELDVTQRWAVIAYIDALVLSQGARVAELPEDVREELTQEVGP
jgi:mono/diheme cytochrome c family protein